MTPEPRPASSWNSAVAGCGSAWLGTAAMLLILEELNPGTNNPRRRLGPLRHLAPYLTRRLGPGRAELPDLMVPDQFRQTFLDWAEGRVNFTAAKPD